MRRFLLTGMLVVATFLATGCDWFGDGGTVIQNSARFTKASVPLGSIAPDPSVAEPRVVDPGTQAGATNLVGDLCYAILSLGDLGPGMFAMTWLAPADTFPNGPTSGTSSTVQFSLASPSVVSGQILVPTRPADMPTRQQIIRAELAFNYVDATFDVAGTLDGTFTIRTVYATTATAPDTTGTMYRGDKLIRLPLESAFQWASAAGLATTRPTTPYQDATVTDAVYAGDGNPDYVPVTANFPTALDVTHDLITDTSRVWTLSFDISSAIVWSTDPDAITAEADLVEAFRLKFGPNQSSTSGETDDGIRASLTIE
jgi:hypothetical protein